LKISVISRIYYSYNHNNNNKNNNKIYVHVRKDIA